MEAAPQRDANGPRPVRRADRRRPPSRPLLVTEGTARDKLRAIEANAYLAHSLQTLRSIELPSGAVPMME